MNVTDPIGDMLTRIRNAQMRRQAKVQRRLIARGRVLDVLRPKAIFAVIPKSADRCQAELRDRAQVSSTASRDPRDQAGVEAGPARVRLCRELPTVSNGLGVSIVSTPKGVMSDCAGARGECRRRSVLQQSSRRTVLPSRQTDFGGGTPMSRIGKKPVPSKRRDGDDSTARPLRSKGRRAMLSVMRPTRSIVR